MANLFPFNILNNQCIKLCICRDRDYLQVIKMDGTIIEFKAPILVKELLMDFEGFEVKSSRKSTDHYPPNFELQPGKKYYLFPSSKSQDRAINPTATNDEPHDRSVKRIKVVITKKQLQEMLSDTNTTMLEKIITGIDKACLANSGANWRPNLTSIPEGNEFNTV